jgi:aminodeoxyfutalosine synthase
MERVRLVDGIVFRDETLLPLWEKVSEGSRLTAEEGLRLFETPDWTAVGQMGDFAKRRISGEEVFFVINRQINPSNLCINSCKFCDFSRKRGDSDVYEMTIAEILEALDDEIREVHIVGGHHPDWPFEHHEEVLRAIHERCPQAHIKAFTASEIDHFERLSGVSPQESLPRLKAVGLSSMPGGGAEVFSPRLHEALFPNKVRAERWLEIHGIAHGLGLSTNCTMLYGHIETLAERVHHFIALREQQDETGGFLCFVPLQYQLGRTRLVERAASPIENLRMVAVSRLMLDNIPHIKAYWVMMSEEIAALALNFGADDIDGTIGRERVAHAADAPSPIGLARERMVRLIRDSGKVPVERDALYNAIAMAPR